MKKNKEGFLFPVIDSKKCTKCLFCEKVCPILKKSEIQKNTLNKIYAVKSRNQKTQTSSSSGGTFSELARYFLDQKGLVFGVSFENNLTKHIFIDNKKDIRKLRGSKYLQSYIGNSFLLVEKFLKNKKKVLFVGLPCQIAGLKSFIELKGVNKKNLFLVDLACHGVPSYKIFNDHILDISNGKKIINVEFRNKKSGWKFYSLAYSFEKGDKIIFEYTKDFFMRGYLRNYFLRKSCYDCKFSKLPRQGDITLADFWGIPSKYYDNRGVSLVLLSSKKGREVFKKIKKDVYFKTFDSNLISPKSRVVSGKYSKQQYAQRKEFFEDYFSKGYGYCKNKYFKSSIREDLINMIKKLKWKIIK